MNLKVGKMKVEDQWVYVMKDGNKPIGLYNLNKYLDKIYKSTLNDLHERKAKSKMYKGKNHIVFDNEQDATKCLEYIAALIMIEKLED